MLVTSVAWLIFCMYHTKFGKLLQHSAKLQPPLPIHLHGNLRVESWAAMWKCRVAMSCSPTLSLGPSSSKIRLRTSPYMSRHTTNITVTWRGEGNVSCSDNHCGENGSKYEAAIYSETLLWGYWKNSTMLLTERESVLQGKAGKIFCNSTLKSTIPLL